MASSQENERDPSAERTVLLDIPARLQWENGHGFCGETAIQSFGLYYGAWISQKLVRDINGGEYFLQKLPADDSRDPLRTLTILHFNYDEWHWQSSPQPQFREYCRWMKQSILRGHPVMFAVYLLYMQAAEYDHIMPAIGVRFTNEDEYDPEDVLLFHNLYHARRFESKMKEGELIATRKSCRRHCGEGGCIPRDVDYGIAVTGIVDADRVTRPVRLSVSAWNEPNLHPAYNEAPIEMDGVVTVSDLTVGQSYSLLSYSSYEHVPTKGDAQAFLESDFDEQHRFTATESSYVYADPKRIPSTGSVYYRCVPNPQ